MEGKEKSPSLHKGTHLKFIIRGGKKKAETLGRATRKEERTKRERAQPRSEKKKKEAAKANMPIPT